MIAPGRDGGARRRQTRAAAVARGLWGATCVLRAEDVARAAATTTTCARPATTFARVLGARELVQGAATAALPTAGTVRVGVAVDVLHAVSMCGLAVVDGSRRRPALLNALTATGWALLAHRLRPAPTAPTSRPLRPPRPRSAP